ncbi:putative ribonuclease H-like domain-containing protein [Tanacetum coccineum]
MDLKSVFLYGKIEEEVYVCQLPGFEDPKFLDKVYKVEKALYGLHQAPRARYETLSTYLLDNGFYRGQIDKTLFIKSIKDDNPAYKHRRICAKILKKFDFSSIKTANTPMETNKALIKDEEAEDVDVHLYRSMIGSLMFNYCCPFTLMLVRHQLDAAISSSAAKKEKERILSRKDNTLFDTKMAFQASEEVGEDSDHPTIPIKYPYLIHHLSSSTSPHKKKQKTKEKRKEAELLMMRTEA